MKKPAYILLAVLVAFANSCGNDDNGTPLPAMTEIAKGVLVNYGSYRQEDRVIDNQNEWTNLMTSLRPFINQSDSLIDFDAFAVVVIFDALRGASGYSVEVLNVVEQGTSMVVEIQHIGPEEVTEEGMYRPFHIVKIPKPGKPLEFVHTAVPPQIYYSSIIRGQLSGNEGIEKLDTVITTESDWKDLLESMNSFFNNPGFPDNVPQTIINFDEYMVIATFDRLDCSYPCYGIIYRDVIDIFESETAISVKIQNLDASVTGGGYPQPFHIVKIPRSSKPVVFIHE